MQWSGRVAIVTGAGSGIGKAVTLGLAQAGYAIVLAGRRADVLQSSALEASAAGTPTLAVATDVTNPIAVEELFAKAEAAFGRLDLLFNNAGQFGPVVPLEDLSYEEWRAVIETNLSGAFLCTREAVRLMKSQQPRGGRIINNGSISAHSPRPYSVAYTASKHAITGLTKATSLEGRDHDIACGQIDIGNASTDMTGEMARGVRQASGILAPEPTMDIRHVVDAVLFMAGLPLESNVQFLTVMATKMPFLGRG